MLISFAIMNGRRFAQGGFAVDSELLNTEGFFAKQKLQLGLSIENTIFMMVEVDFIRNFVREFSRFGQP